jgi:CDP-diacylglycerol---serine O-phosphatidyltransferase
VPAPAGAITGMLPLYLLKLGVGALPGFAPLAVVYVLVIAFLMVSELPIYAAKTLGTRVTRDKVLWVFLGIVLFVSLITNFTFETLAAITLAYLAMIPWSVRHYKALDRAWNDSRASKQSNSANDAKI